MSSSRQIHRLLQFAAKPLLAAVFVTLILRLSLSPPPPRKPVDPHPHVSKTLVVASTTLSDLTWLESVIQTSHWTTLVYTTDSATASHRVPVNKGNEAMVYLTYIIDHYDSLPDVVFFHHDHEKAWHQIYSSSWELAHINPSSVVSKGYLNPRCLPGCENVIELTGDVAPVEDLKGRSREIQIASFLHEFSRDEKTGHRIPLPEKIAAPCCAQFAVSRAAIQKRSLKTWTALRKWLIETELDSRSSGRVFEYTWHLWFGMDPLL